MNLLQVSGLKVTIETRTQPITPIRGIGFSLKAGETLGLVGESGCGKSLTSLALMGLLPPNAELLASEFSFLGKDLLKLKSQQRRKIQGSEMAMIFQDPMTSLNPSFTIGFQMNEVLKVHQSMTRHQRQKRINELLIQVGIPSPDRVIRSYPHQLSGGMCQRVMIAIAIACSPKLLIADEPTTALDVTIQAQILSLLKSLQQQNNMALLLITHDIAVVAQLATKLAVMYAGEIVEWGTTQSVLEKPLHPYTRGLLNCLPEMQQGNENRLTTIPGMVPDLAARPRGCQLHPRCFQKSSLCEQKDPPWVHKEHRAAMCHQPLSLP